MKLANSNNGTVVASHGVQQTSTFNIARTPHMFNILSSGLYSNKIAAVLREIGCNATDAHIMNGCPERPIQVKLPTKLDPSFYIKDWGPGLDDEEVTQLYTTYGWSSKQQNDEVTGAFGLGSKSPFAYTLQNRESASGFSVESVKNGVKRIYVCFINDEGAPAISLLHTGPSEPEWQHGVKVSFAIQEPDITEFHIEARNVFQWFRVQPEVLGLEGGKISAPEFSLKGEHFGLSAQARSGVVMGNVFYPLDSNSLRDLSKNETALISAGIVLFVPMGTVMMTPSREGLEYTDKTRRGVREYLSKAVTAIAKTLRDNVMAPAESKWAWHHRIREYYEQLPSSMRFAVLSLLEEAGVPGEDIKHIDQVLRESALFLPTFAGGKEAVEKGLDVWLYRVGAREGSVSRKRVNNGKIAKGAYDTESVLLGVGRKVAILYEDCKSSDWRIRNAVREGKFAYVVAVMGKNPAAVKAHAEAIALDESIEGIPLVKTSTLAARVVPEEERLRRKALREMAAIDAVGHLSCGYVEVRPDGYASSDIALRDVPESGQFYVVKSSFGRRGRNVKLWNKQGDKTLTLIPDTYSNVRALSALHKVLGLFSEPITGYLEVESKGDLKKMRLEELGFKPLLVEIENRFNDEDFADEMSSLQPSIQDCDLDQTWSADEAGLVGRFAYALNLGGPAADVIRASLAGTEFLNVAEQLVRNNQVDPRYTSVMNLVPLLSGLELQWPEAPPQVTKREIAKQMLEKYPQIRFLHMDVSKFADKEHVVEFLTVLKQLLPVESKALQLVKAA